MNGRTATRAELRQLAGLARARERRLAGECLVEGATLLGEALAAALAPRVVVIAESLADRHGDLLDRAHAAGATVLWAPAGDLSKEADRDHGPPLLAALPLPPAGLLSDLPAAAPALVAVLCGLQDPGNVGTLLRSARAFGASLCVTLPGTADVWGPKVIRSSAGAVFAMPCLAVDDLESLLGATDLRPVAALPPEPASPVESAGRSPDAPSPEGQSPERPLPERCLLLLGHETRGLSSVSGVPAVTVPQVPGVDSLNVAMAGSILMADWYRALST